MTKEQMKDRTKKYALRVIKAVQTLTDNRVGTQGIENLSIMVAAIKTTRCSN